MNIKSIIITKAYKTLLWNQVLKARFALLKIKFKSVTYRKKTMFFVLKPIDLLEKILPNLHNK